MSNILLALITINMSCVKESVQNLIKSCHWRKLIRYLSPRKSWKIIACIKMQLCRQHYISAHPRRILRYIKTSWDAGWQEPHPHTLRKCRWTFLMYRQSMLWNVKTNAWAVVHGDECYRTHYRVSWIDINLLPTPEIIHVTGLCHTNCISQKMILPQVFSLITRY